VPGLSVCLLLDERADRAVRALWRRLEDDGVRTLSSYTHGRHVPHLTLASLGGPGGPGGTDVAGVSRALERVGFRVPLAVDLQALGVFTRSRCWLLPTVGADLLAWQAEVGRALAAYDVHRHYRPGAWQPHVTLAPRMSADLLPLVAARVFEVVPLPATATRLALVDTGTGDVHTLDAG
jgi:2'-5' RNA ligase